MDGFSWKRHTNRPSSRSKVRSGDKFGVISPATWTAVDAVLVGEFVQRITDCGAWCSFSKASDGGVLLATILYGNEKWTIDPRSGEEAAEQLREAIEHFASDM